MSRALLDHAADLLDAQAHTLARSYSRTGDWSGHPDAKADHDDLLRTAQSLRELTFDQPPQEKRHAK